MRGQQPLLIFTYLRGGSIVDDMQNPTRRTLIDSEDYRKHVGDEVVDVALPLPPAMFDFIDFNIYGTAV